MISYFFKKIILDKSIPWRQKIVQLKESYFIYQRLKKLVRSGEIYHSLEDKKITNDFLDNFSNKDYKLIKKIFEEDVKEFLKTNNLKNFLTFENKEDFRQIGYGSILVQKPVKSLWTTGKALFYLPFMKDKDNKFKLEFYSIPPITVSVSFEGKYIEKIQLGILSSKLFEFVIKKRDFKEDVCKIEVTTDKLWLPHKLIKRNEDVLAGIGIISIANIT